MECSAYGSVGTAFYRLGFEEFETHHRQSHCVVSLSKTLFPLLSTGSIQEIVLT